VTQNDLKKRRRGQRMGGKEHRKGERESKGRGREMKAIHI
jgi:hypothetical protein